LQPATYLARQIIGLNVRISDLQNADNFTISGMCPAQLPAQAAPVITIHFDVIGVSADAVDMLRLADKYKCKKEEKCGYSAYSQNSQSKFNQLL
jgi:hypothetical protein